MKNTKSSLLEEALTNRLADHTDLQTRHEMIRNGFYSSSKFINSHNPTFTDHSDSHIIDVQNVLYELIKQKIDFLNHVELYILVCATYFHDWGNIIDRQFHNEYAPQFYRKIFTPSATENSELIALNAITRAHSGYSTEGNKDTLNNVSPREFIFRTPVNVQRLAALLKLADELAESKNRTSIEHIRHGNLNDESLKHHFYSQSIEINIETEKGCINATYYIGYKCDNSKFFSTCIGTGKKIDLLDFLSFVSKRLNKTNIERKYTKYYLRNFISLDEISATIILQKIDIDDTGEYFSGTNHQHTKVITDKIIPDAASEENDCINVNEIIAAISET